MSGTSPTREEIHDELERSRTDFHALVATATPADLRRSSSGTRWTNGQLLFHMFFGYLIVRRLLPLARLMGRLPEPVSRTFARTLEVGTRPFHIINYQSDRGAARMFHGPRLLRWFDRTLDVLQARLETEPAAGLARGMHMPVSWDPYFRDWMSLAEIYHYGTQHYDHHRQQLTIGRSSRGDP
ncbi:DinB family protein [uncultured Kocuria sp.]|uniref:DinB family protein n=1 Tax=uncultured Kocuria sp. TaxID=259305 RepID=UPI002601E30C|nr:DinB family protein [uncultured Kocuria sp.]